MGTPALLEALHPAVRLMSSTYSQQILQHYVVQLGVGQHTFELGVLILHRLQLRDLGHIHPALLRFVLAERGLAETVLAAHLCRRHSGFLYFEHPDDLGFPKTALSHLFTPSKG